MVFPAYDQARIRAGLSAVSAAALQELSLLDQTGSTSDVLLQLPAAGRHAQAVLADRQTAGRGRRGRRWQSPAGCNIYLSVGWNFNHPPAELSCLPLAIGVAVVLGLEHCGVSDLGLKWPNDIQVKDKKLGGILLESRRIRSGGISVVAGIGLNVGMQAGSGEAEAINQPWTCVAECMNNSAFSFVNDDLRDRLAAKVLDQLIACFLEFELSGFEHYRPDWSRLDVLHGRNISVRSLDQVWEGQSRGIDQQGRLLLAETSTDGQQQLKPLDAGEVSVRLA